MKIIPIKEVPYPDDFPPKEYYVQFNKVSYKQLEEFRNLLNDNVGETKINEFLKFNHEVLVNVLENYNTGHHGSWIIHKQTIRLPQSKIKKGLIPDIILGAKSSDGFSWYVLELKSTNETLFKNSNNNIRLSDTANRAVMQILEYIDYCSFAQSYLRDTLKLTNFREPKGIILLGQEDEFNDERRQNLKSAWNKNSEIQIRTYNSLLRLVESAFKYRKNI